MKTLLASALRTTSFLTTLLLLGTAQPAMGQTNFTLLKSFSGLAEAGTGALLYSGVIQGSDGCLYGTTATGGSNVVAVGTVFKLRTNGVGFVVLHHFSGPDGAVPYAPVFEASDGFLYGAAYSGGVSNAGTVFKLAKDGSQFALLHEFTGGADSKNPRGAVIEGSDGYLYGTTEFGNSSARGTVFKLLENGGGYSTIRNFTSGTNGAGPIAGVIEASDGWLYGTTQLGGGVSGGGVVFKLDRFGGNYSVIKSFASSGTDLRMPIAELVEANNGALYGSAPNGGISNKGGIFRLNKDGSGYIVLRHFVGRTGGGDGEAPKMALLRGSDDVFYGTSQNGGQIGAGTVFILSTNALPPRALALSKTGSTPVIEFTGTGATQYTIENSTNLTTWSDLTTVTTPIHGVTSFTNASPAEPAAYFHVRLQQ